jgi:hypothetical protein
VSVSGLSPKLELKDVQYPIDLPETPLVTEDPIVFSGGGMLSVDCLESVSVVGPFNLIRCAVRVCHFDRRWNPYVQIEPSKTASSSELEAAGQRCQIPPNVVRRNRSDPGALTSLPPKSPFHATSTTLSRAHELVAFLSFRYI